MENWDFPSDVLTLIDSMVWHRVTSISSHKLEQAPLSGEAKKL